MAENRVGALHSILCTTTPARSASSINADLVLVYSISGRSGNMKALRAFKTELDLNNVQGSLIAT